MLPILLPLSRVMQRVQLLLETTREFSLYKIWMVRQVICNLTVQMEKREQSSLYHLDSGVPRVHQISEPMLLSM